MQPARPASAGASDWALAILGTPFVFAFRVVACTATAVVAAPTAGLLVLAPDPGPGLAYLRDGLGQNCGPPYGMPVPVAAGYRAEPDISYYAERAIDYFPRRAPGTIRRRTSWFIQRRIVGAPRPLTPLPPSRPERAVARPRLPVGRRGPPTALRLVSADVANPGVEGVSLPVITSRCTSGIL